MSGAVQPPSLAEMLLGFDIGSMDVAADGTVASWCGWMSKATGWDANHVLGRAATSLFDPGIGDGGGAREAIESAAAAPANEPIRSLGSLRCASGAVLAVALHLRPEGGRRATVLVVPLESVVALPGSDPDEPLIGASGPMQQARRILERAARSDASVLITGESGTGKELAAQAIHRQSARHDQRFVAVNCSAFQESLLESELFGHVAGAFTGAQHARVGLVAHADRGTLFLDEVGEVSAAVQAKLLRVLQEREVRPVGANEPIPVDIRLVTATHRRPDELLSSGRLRADFYYRIRVLEVTMPPLRDRIEDIPLLVGAFLEQLTPAARPRTVLSREALACLQAYRWPGNVRQLRNTIEHATVATDGGIITPAHLPLEVLRGTDPAASDDLEVADQRERERIVTALELHGWNRTRAAEALGISRVTLWKKIRRYRLDPTPFRRQ